MSMANMCLTLATCARYQILICQAGTSGAVLMVESEAKELTEDQMLGAVLFAHQEMQAIITAVAEPVKLVSRRGIGSRNRRTKVY